MPQAPAGLVRAARALAPGGPHRYRLGERSTVTIPCPVHGPERHPSLDLTLGVRGAIHAHCWAGCDPEQLRRACAEAGIPTDPFLVDAPNAEWKPTETGDVGNTGRVTSPRDGDAAEWWGNLPAPWEPELRDLWIAGWGRPIRTWTYRSPEGHGCLIQARYDDGEGAKTYRPWSWWRGEDGRVRLRPRSTPAGQRPLLNLPELWARKDATLVITEGEPAADAVPRLFAGAIGTTEWGGAANLPTIDVRQLRGRTKPTVLIPDNDAPGRSAMMELAGRLSASGIDHITADVAQGWKDLTGQELPPGWDLANALSDAWMKAITEYRRRLPDGHPLRTTTEDQQP